MVTRAINQSDHMIGDAECVHWDILLTWYPKRFALGKKASDITF